MTQVSAGQQCEIQREVEEEIPCDELMQEIHYTRRVHQLETAGMSAKEKTAYFRDKAGIMAAYFEADRP